MALTGTSMSTDAVWAAIDSERRSIVVLLGTLADGEWSRSSLCSGWRIRDVAAHLALAHMGAADALLAFARARGSFDRMVHDTARRHARVPTDQLIDEIRSMAGSRRHAPGISDLEPLVDILVHGQDIAIPLGRQHSMPVEAAAAAATRVWTVKWPLSTAFPARERFAGVRLTATDVDWHAGDGARVEGPIEALLLLLTGRDAWLPRLSGPGLEQLASAWRHG